MKCIKDYRRHSNTYLKGNEYDVSAETIAADETYLGEQLWEGKSKSQKKGEDIQKAPAKKPATKKPAAKSKK